MPRGTPGVFNLASIGTLFEERESKGRLQTSKEGCRPRVASF